MVIVSSTFAPPVDGILLQAAATKLFVNDQELGTATLYITENNVVWCGGVTASGTAAPNISLVYPCISLHAVQREPSPALYMVVNYELRIPQLQQHAGGDADAENDEDDDFDAEEEPITQLRFIPQNENDLQAMYTAMSQGQSLHPDPQDEVDEDDPYMDGEDYYDGDEEEFEDAEETGGSTDEAAARLRQMRLEQVNGNHTQEDSEDAEISED